MMKLLGIIAGPVGFWRTLYLACLLVLVLVLAGCRINPANPASASLELTLAAWADTPQDFAAYNRLIDSFNANNPGFKVRAVLVPKAVYNKQVLAMEQAGNGPDVLWLDHLADWSAAGRLIDLTGQLASDPKWKAERYIPGALELGQFKGRQYALPSTVSTLMIAYNKDLFDAAGIAYPQPDWTYDDFYAAVAQLNGRPGQVGIANPGAFWMPAVLANGGQVIDPESGTFRLDQPDATNAIQKLADLNMPDKAKTLLAGKTSIPAEIGNRLFLSGHAAMLAIDPVQFAPLRATVKFNWDVVALPRGSSIYRSPLLGTPIGIAATSKHPREAYRLLMYLACDQEVQRAQARYGVAPPAIIDKEAEAAFYTVPVAPPGAQEAIQMLDKGFWVSPEYTTPGYSEAIPIIDRALDAVFAGKEPAYKALRRAVPEANRALQTATK